MSDSDPEEAVRRASLREAARRVYGSDPAGYALGRPDYPEEVYAPPDERRSLLDSVRAIAERDFGGEITRPFVTALYTGQRNGR